jgi:hypothetical protein
MFLWENINMLLTMKSWLNSTNKALLPVIVSLLCCSRLSGASSIARTRIPFKGNATAGTLVIGYKTGRNANFVSINTSADESAESVVNRLARAIAYSNAIYDFSRVRGGVNRDAIAAKMGLGSTLQYGGFPGEYFLAGSQTGLGIPRPPLCLTCSYDEQAEKFELRWINPPSEYDCITIMWHYDNSDKGGGDFFPGTPVTFAFDKPADVNGLDLDVWLMGFRHDIAPDVMVANSIPLGSNAIPSDITAIHVTGNGYCQEETYGIPFFAGIAPNWAAWSTAAKPDKAAFEQGSKYVSLDPDLHADLPAYYPRGLLTKPFFQVIKAPAEGVVHGVYRKFLGLTPGHTYRLTACLTTLEMDSIKADWSYSLCATHNGPNGKDLTVQQLAGLAPLPDGTSGPQAGRIAFYSQGNTTKPDFAIVFTGANATVGPQSSHITLPAGADTITVWVRFSCSDPKGKVGFSGVRIEDITAIENPKSPEQILLEENEEEAKFLKWIQQASR